MELIKEISDEILGLVDKVDNQIQYHVRKAARMILLNKHKEIAILHVKNGNYHKLPGGGIEPGESVEEALKREVKEEVGANVIIEGKVGITIEYRAQHHMLQLSYCYYGFVDGEVYNPDFTQKEKEDGFSLHWINPKVAIETLKNDKPNNYPGNFIHARDLSILLKAEELMNII